MSKLLVQGFIVNADDLVGIIYKHEYFGKVVIFHTNKIDIEQSLKIYPAYGGDESDIEKKNLLEMILDVLPK